jgi:hypothetical protein
MVSAIARTIPTVPGFGAMLVPSWLQVCRIFIGNNQRRCVSYFTTSLVFQKRCKSMVGSVKKAPLCWRGQGDSHAARAAGWYPAPAHIPNSGRWNWFQMVVRLRLFLGRAGTVWRCPALLLREGAPHTLSPPSGHPREQKLKIKGESAPGPCFP